MFTSSRTNSSAKTSPIRSSLLTPCRRLGLSRIKKEVKTSSNALSEDVTVPTDVFHLKVKPESVFSEPNHGKERSKQNSTVWGFDYTNSNITDYRDHSSHDMKGDALLKSSIADETDVTRNQGNKKEIKTLSKDIIPDTSKVQLGRFNTEDFLNNTNLSDLEEKCLNSNDISENVKRFICLQKKNGDDFILKNTGKDRLTSNSSSEKFFSQSFLLKDSLEHEDFCDSEEQILLLLKTSTENFLTKTSVTNDVESKLISIQKTNHSKDNKEKIDKTLISSVKDIENLKSDGHVISKATVKTNKIKESKHEKNKENQKNKSFSAQSKSENIVCYPKLLNSSARGRDFPSDLQIDEGRFILNLNEKIGKGVFTSSQNDSHLVENDRNSIKSTEIVNDSKNSTDFSKESFSDSDSDFEQCFKNAKRKSLCSLKSITIIKSKKSLNKQLVTTSLKSYVKSNSSINKINGRFKKGSNGKHEETKRKMTTINDDSEEEMFCKKIIKKRKFVKFKN